MKLLILIIFLILPINYNVKAEKVDCGQYKQTYCKGNALPTENASLTIENGKGFMTTSTEFGEFKSLVFKIENSKCPNYIKELCNYQMCQFWACYESNCYPSADASFERDITTPPTAPSINWGDKYSGIEECTEIDVQYIKACGCIPAEVADITSKIYFILRIIGPIILLLIGGFEMVKAIGAQDESAIEKTKKKLVKKFVAAIAIFLVLTIIEFIVGIIAKDPSSIVKCVEILLDGYVV